MEPMRLLVTDAATQPPRQATAWLIMTLGKKMNKYTRIARVYPALLTGIPVVLLSIPLVNTFLDIVGANQWLAKIVGNLSFSAVILYFYSQLVRILGKFIFEKIYFRDERLFPTTQALHPKGKTFSSNLKDRYYGKVKQDFGIDIQSASDDYELRRMINESVAQVRLKVGKGKLLLQHNIEYGFIRNFCGGSLFGFFCSLVGVIIYWSSAPVFPVYVTLLFGYLLFVVLSKTLINHFGFQYTKVLISEYMEDTHA